MSNVIDETGAPVPVSDGPPDDWSEIAESMSNFDHVIDDGMADRLREGGCFSRHAAWNFNGLVWYQAGRFHEQVWVYGSPREVISADSLDELMAEVNSEYGSE